MWVPGRFEAFSEIEGVPARTVKNRVARLRLHELRRSSSGASNLFGAEMGNGRLVKGMLFAGELMWGDDEPALAGARLGRHRRTMPRLLSPDPRGATTPGNGADVGLPGR